MYCSLPTRELTFLTNVIEYCYWVTSRPFFKLEHLLMVKTNQLNGKCFASSHIHPSLSSSSSYGRRHWAVAAKEDYQVRFPLTFLERHRDHSMIVLGSILVLALRGARVVMAPRPHVGGGRGSVSLCKGIHWSHWHRFLFHHVLTSYCLSVFG